MGSVAPVCCDTRCNASSGGPVALFQGSRRWVHASVRRGGLLFAEACLRRFFAVTLPLAWALSFQKNGEETVRTCFWQQQRRQKHGTLGGVFEAMPPAEDFQYSGLWAREKKASRLGQAENRGQPFRSEGLTGVCLALFAGSPPRIRRRSARRRCYCTTRVQASGMGLLLPDPLPEPGICRS